MATAPKTTTDELLDFIAANDRIAYLKGRWLDEREYEDFAEYKAELKKVFEAAGYEFIGSTPSFNMRVRKGADEWVISYGVRSVSVKRFGVKEAA